MQMKENCHGHFLIILAFFPRYLLCGQTATGELAFTPARDDHRVSSLGSTGAMVVPATPPPGTSVPTLALVLETRTAGSQAVQVSSKPCS